HHGQRTSMTYTLLKKSQSANAQHASIPTFIARRKPRRYVAPPQSAATATVIMTGNAIKPKNIFGMPNTNPACHVCITVEQFKTLLSVHDRTASGFLIRMI